jgi:hypothetical protein
LGVNHDTFLERKSMNNVKNDGIEDEAREEKHDDSLGVEKLEQDPEVRHCQDD